MLLLPALAGVHNALLRNVMQGAGDHVSWPGLLGIALILGPIFGIIWMLIFSYLLRWTGSWLGGTASARRIVTVFAWSRVPMVWIMPLWILLIAVFGQALFQPTQLEAIATPQMRLIYLLFMLAVLVTSIWSLVVLVAGLSEVQQFGVGRAIVNLLLVLLVIIVAAVLLALGLSLIGLAGGTG